ncbi:RNA polymerase II transcriptional regulation mediator [Pseudoloma neurophilia]|uniref:Mediator of RNA polymerase II transcription subunit 6 n=1 Tax=Pseudoloma neurophilia TaxID=146866 RepID=A0A0R0LZH7_9MICR|nr:RNA polymerase II transcriptional regulation mediator [Pseudoloma neurophilia]
MIRCLQKVFSEFHQITNPSAQELMHSFTDPSWLEENPLTTETAISYFARSPFYDGSCLNETLRMQTQFSNFFDLNQKLQELDGLRYFVEEKNEIFYIYKINKQKTEETLVDFHYIMFGTIFKGTTQYGVAKARMYNFLFFVDESIEKFYKRRDYDPYKGLFLKSTDKSDEEAKQKDKEEDAIREYVLRELAFDRF